MDPVPNIVKTLDKLRYTVVCPWDSLRYSLDALAADPGIVLHWRELKKGENLLIGLVGTIVSAVVATMFQWPQLLTSPWTAQGSLLVALSFGVISVIMALQQTFFLNELAFRASPVDQARRIVGGPPQTAGDLAMCPTPLQVRFTTALVWHLPHMALGASIYALIVGLTIMVVHPATTAERWSDQWKIAIAYFISLTGSILAYFSCGFYQHGAI